MLIQFMENPDEPTWKGYIIAFLMFITSNIATIFVHQSWDVVYRLQINVRSCLTNAIYSKALKLSNEARKEFGCGEIMNLVNGDVPKVEGIALNSMKFWAEPMQIIVSIYIIWNLLGISAFSGLLVLLASIQMNKFISEHSRKVTSELVKNQGEQTRMESEVLNGIKVLKMYSWEKSMENMILNIREKGLALFKKKEFVYCCSYFFWDASSLLASAVTFTTFVFLDPENNKLTPELSFVILSLFAIIRIPVVRVGYMYGQAIEFSVVNNRLKTFFAAEEVDPIEENCKEKDFAISIKNGEFSWISDESPTLRDITFNINRGQLVAIVGTVGSGKSSLLHAILRDMKRKSGVVEVNGSIAYVPQQSWIQNLSLKDNILFGDPMNSNNYEKAIRNCALVEDLKSLPAGDRTEIGEKGINLSGGQKQRVSLARAVYHNADIVLMDDPLSAVDSHVGKHIWNNVISSETGCLSSKTRILVTHGLTYLKYCDQVIVLNNGSISEMGTYQELLENDGTFSKILDEYLVDENDEVIGEASGTSDRVDKNLELNMSQKRDEEFYENRENDESYHLIEKETIESGSVNSSFYLDFLQSIGFFTFTTFLIACVARSSVEVWANKYLAEMSEEDETDTKIKLLGYTSLCFGKSIAMAVAGIIWIQGTVEFGRVLYAMLLGNILRSPMSFFDVTPIGRLLNLLGKDMESAERLLPSEIQEVIKQSIVLISKVSVIIWTVPSSGFLIGVLTIGYFYVMRYFISTSRQLKRLESALRSPIISNFQESIQGASSIRAFNSVNRFILQSQKIVDDHLRAYFLMVTANRWLAVRLESIGNLIVLFTAGAAVYFRDSYEMSSGIVALSVTYALSVTHSLQWNVRAMGELESLTVSIERIKNYMNIRNEGMQSKNLSISESWPEKGEIQIKNLSIRYRQGLDLVLHGVSAHIKSGEKIGIVGRTGAGKSSLTLALFRIVEADEGSIEVDGIDISVLNLDDLRSRLTIVPQDPVCFSGSLRMNLDPFSTFSNAQIWEALRNAHLAHFVEILPGGLDFPISEGGENVSVGQRQLMCLARALLRKTKILVLDEAAAAVDVGTDSLIQRTIQEQFKDCTVITIAHRLNTIMSCDRILVLDKGRVIEFDSPRNLLLNPQGMFYSMAKDDNIIQ
ncbi:hypothetical protein GCK72_001544 [Caenorhabditis remanei]|uniref:Uncharacterized protein n=1 Tax=Caenorhabditis remanei TaxID=31234 RepID=A0A6A5HTR9_CAERE|nr:hypothetical protein GCK72_001544 [Caenorhabditis remanei]KAF1769727.1 hypothetical protein GCK72_001544 [Caenorhabditis remanei]